MITHDELIFCVRQKYPNLVHGVDFWVGQNICRDTGKQLEAARLHVLGQRASEERAAVNGRSRGGGRLLRQLQRVPRQDDHRGRKHGTLRSPYRVHRFQRSCPEKQRYGL